MTNSLQIVPQAPATVTVSPSAGWFTDSGLTVPAVFPASISASATYYTANTGSFFVQGVISGSDRIGSQVTIKAGAAVVLAAALRSDDRSGFAAYRPSASVYGPGPWYSIDTGSLDESDGSTWKTGVSQRRSAFSSTTVVASRNNSYYLGINGSSSTQTFYSKHLALVNITALTLWYGNSYGTSAGAQGDGPGNLLVNASVLLPSNTTPFRGTAPGGARIATITPGATVPITVGVTIPKGTFFFVATYVNGNWPTGLALNAAKGVGYDTTGDPSVTTDSGEGIASPSTTDTTATGVKSSSFVVAYTPLLITGVTRDFQPVFVGVGDSILCYSNESTDMGWFIRGVNNRWPVLKLAQPGETALQWAVNGTAPSLVDYRKQFLRYGSHFVFGYGRNDVSAARTLAQIQADLITAWAEAVVLGGLSWQSTITPKVTTTDQYATLANQTVDTNNAVRVNLNNWLRDGAPMLAGAAVATGSSAAGTLRAGQAGHPLVGYLEVADVVESSRDSGKWSVAQVRTVADAAMTTGATPKVLTSATAAFTSADVGKSVFVAGAGTAGAVLATTIAVVTNSTTVGLVGSAQTTVTGAALQIGAATYDGTHPDGFYHRAIAAVVAPTFAAAAAAYVG